MKDHDNLIPVVGDALRGDEESQHVVAYLYRAGAAASSRKDLPTIGEVWEILHRAKEVLDICEMGTSAEIIHACCPAAVDQAKMLLNAVDEQIPGAEAKLRKELSQALFLREGMVTFDQIWEMRNEPLARMQLIALLAAHLRV